MDAETFLFIVDVGVLVLIERFLRRYTSLRLFRFKFGSGFLKLLTGSVAFLLLFILSVLSGVGARMYGAGMGGPDLGLLDSIFVFSLIILPGNLILLGLIDLTGAAIKMIDAAVKKRQA